MLRLAFVSVLLLAASAPIRAQEKSAQQTIAAEVRSLMEKHNVPGVSVAVVDGGRLAWAEGFGVREAGGADKIDAGTVFQMASVSKPIAGLGAMVLASRKTLDLDADVNTILKSWKLPASDAAEGETVTLRRLLGHRAGTTVHGFPGYAAGKPVPTVVQVLDGEKPANTPAVRVDRKPGGPVKYSGGGYCVAQLAMADATGKPFPKLMDELVLAPLKMTHSSYEQPPSESLKKNLAVAHRAGAKPIPGKFHVYPEMAAAGLWSTPTDLAHVIVEFNRAWIGKSKLLTAGQVKDLFATGIGWPGQFTGDRFVAVHGGSNAGYRCVFAVSPATGQGAVILTNSDDGDKLLDPALKAIRKAYKW